MYIFIHDCVLCVFVYISCSHQECFCTSFSDRFIMVLLEAIKTMSQLEIITASYISHS